MLHGHQMKKKKKLQLQVIARRIIISIVFNIPFQLQVIAGGLLGVITAVVGHLVTLAIS